MKRAIVIFLSVSGLSASAAKKTAEPVVGKAGIEWVTIPSGRYVPSPLPRSTIARFEMSRTEVTVAQYRQCVDAGACSEPQSRGVVTTDEGCNWGESGREDHPINCVDWNQAVEFATWVGGRLPSEAEWEYAARYSKGLAEAGSRTVPWGTDAATCSRVVVHRVWSGEEIVELGGISTIGGYSGVHKEDCGHDSTAPVCSKPEGNNPQGLCDLVGNVHEWVQDTYQDRDFRTAPRDGSAWEVDGQAWRVHLGGSWKSVYRKHSYPFKAMRMGREPRLLGEDLGFRVAR